MELLNILREELSENRRDQARKFNIADIVFSSVIAILMGATTTKSIYLWLKENMKKKEIKELLGYEFVQVPKKTTVYDLFKIVDEGELERAFRRWIRTLVDIKAEDKVSADGKVIKSSKRGENKAVMVLSILLQELGIVIAHEKIASKSNEIPALQKLIGELDETFIYTFDALHTQKKLYLK